MYCIYVNIYIHTHIYVHIHTNIYVYTHTYIFHCVQFLLPVYGQELGVGHPLRHGWSKGFQFSNWLSFPEEINCQQLLRSPAPRRGFTGGGRSCLIKVHRQSMHGSAGLYAGVVKETPVKLLGSFNTTVESQPLSQPPPRSCALLSITAIPFQVS